MIFIAGQLDEEFSILPSDRRKVFQKLFQAVPVVQVIK